MSGSQQRDVQGYALVAGSDGFFEKPFTADALLERMKELLGE
jgi:DNA-binding response OmpR family regulator